MNKRINGRYSKEFRDEAAKLVVEGGVSAYEASRQLAWKELDLLGAVSYAVIRQYIWYGGSSCKTCNDVDRGFYESIKLNIQVVTV